MNIKKYQDINNNAKKNLLLGNGFSIGVSTNFSYRSLRDVCQKENYLLATDDKLFEEFDTDDFELLLDKLNTTKSVNKILGIDDNLPLERYKTIRDSLIKAVGFIHRMLDSIDPQWIERVFKEFKKFDKIFTTNYDLLIYWIAACYRFEGFADYFWSEGLTFDQFNTEVSNNKIPILYLHGALFIYKDIDTDRIRKVQSVKNKPLLTCIEEKWKDNAIPVFVSEGSSFAKENAIYTNPYLRFAFFQLLVIKGGLTIFGHSLSEVDQHIVDAINKNEKLENIAVSVYRGSKDDDEIEKEIDNITKQLKKFTKKGRKLELFDSATCPLSYPARN